MHGSFPQNRKCSFGLPVGNASSPGLNDSFPIKRITV
jgi:hypothetical protein